MSLEELKGKEVAVEISDPWEFEAENGPGPHLGAVTAVRGDYVLVSLKNPVTVRHHPCTVLSASARYERDSLDQILSGKRIAATMAAISDPNWSEHDPIGLAAWKRGMGLTGVVYLNPSQSDA